MMVEVEERREPNQRACINRTRAFDKEDVPKPLLREVQLCVPLSRLPLSTWTYIGTYKNDGQDEWTREPNRSMSGPANMILEARGDLVLPSP